MDGHSASLLIGQADQSHISKILSALQPQHSSPPAHVHVNHTMVILDSRDCSIISIGFVSTITRISVGLIHSNLQTLN